MLFFHICSSPLFYFWYLWKQDDLSLKIIDEVFIIKLYQNKKEKQNDLGLILKKISFFWKKSIITPNNSWLCIYFITWILHFYKKVKNAAKNRHLLLFSTTQKPQSSCGFCAYTYFRKNFFAWQTPWLNFKNIFNFLHIPTFF